MHGLQIEKFIRKDCYQLFILDSPLPFPLSLFRHSYVVVNDHGDLTRWDVLHRKYPRHDRKGYVYKNVFLPWCGLGKFYLPFAVTGHFAHFEAKMVGFLEGESHSETGYRIASIASLVEQYPYSDFYSALPGPNSNTFAQWILNFFPEMETSLSVTAIGRSYKG